MNGHAWDLLVFFIGLTVGILGFFGKRWFDGIDANRARIEAEKESRMARLEAATAKLAEVVAELGIQISRHIGYHDRHDDPESRDDPLLG